MHTFGTSEWFDNLDFPNLVPRVSLLPASWSEPGEGSGKKRDPWNEVAIFRDNERFSHFQKLTDYFIVFEVYLKSQTLHYTIV